MKSKFLLPALTAAIGFTLAWVAKPTGSSVTAVSKTEVSDPKRTTRTEPRRPEARDASKRPKEVKASDFPLADQADQGPKSRDEARMLRLKEALGLSTVQEAELLQLIEDVQASADGNVPALQDLQTRGNKIEEGLAKLLSPEQLAKFQEMRIRERENRVEARSQKMLSAAIEEIDLSPEQREEVLDRLRQKSKADLQTIPAAATLFLDKSILPTNGKELSADGVLLLAKIGEEVSVGDPMVAHQKVIDQRRQDLEEMLRCFDGILSSGQMGQYQAALSETRDIMKKLPQNPTAAAAPAATPPPQEDIQTEILPDDEEGMTPEEEAKYVEGSEEEED